MVKKLFIVYIQRNVKSNMSKTDTQKCFPKRHDVLFADKVERCPFCGEKIWPDGDSGSFYGGYR